MNAPSNKAIFLVALSYLMLAGCSTGRVYFTVDAKKELDKAGIQLQKVQFYPSTDLVLVRELAKEEIGVVKGKVRVEDGRKVEEIIIPAGTPGVCESNDERSLMVSFDKGNDQKLMFLVEKRNGVVTEGSYFKVAAKEWKQIRNGGRIGILDYQGKLFNLVRGQEAKLMIDRSLVSRTDRKTTVAKGRKLN